MTGIQLPAERIHQETAELAVVSNPTLTDRTPAHDRTFSCAPWPDQHLVKVRTIVARTTRPSLAQRARQMRSGTRSWQRRYNLYEMLIPAKERTKKFYHGQEFDPSKWDWTRRQVPAVS